MECRIKYFQPGFFAIPVGLGGLSIAYQKLALILHNSLLKLIGEGLAYLGLAVWLIVATIYLIKMAKFREEFLKDIRNITKLTILPLSAISLLILSIAFNHFAPQVAVYFAYLGLVLQIAFTLFILRKWISEDLHIQMISPTWYIPVVGLILIPITPLKLGTLNWLFLTFGLVFWNILTVIIFYRKFFHEPLPEALIPSLFILLAPPSIGFISYIKVTNSFDVISHFLYFTALTFFIVLLINFDKFVKTKFKITWWAYIFPLDALTIATILYFKLSKELAFLKLAELFAALATFALLIVAYKTFVAIKRKEICQAE